MTAKRLKGLWLLMPLLLVGCDFSRTTVSCHEHIAAGDTGRYLIKDSGIVLDPDTGVEWYRCAFGQRHTLRGCTGDALLVTCLLYTSPSPRDRQKSRMPSSA